MFFKRPSFKYGGQAEGIKQTVRRNFSAGTNPNRTGNAFVKDIFESKAPTSFNVMNQGIGQGLEMKQPSAAMGMANFDDSYLSSVLQPKEKMISENLGDASIAEQIAMESGSTAVKTDKKEPPGIFGFKFDRPITGEDLLGERGKEVLEEKRQAKRDEIQASIDARAEEKNVADFDTSKLPKDDLKDTETTGKDDFATADDLAAKNLANNPGGALTDLEKESALTGKDIPMFEKFLGPKEAEIKRKAYLAAAKAGFRLMKKDVATVGEAAIVDAEKILKEKADLERVAALKGLDFEKDMLINQMKIDAKLLSKDPSRLMQMENFYTQRFKAIYGDKITDAEARAAAQSYMASYGSSQTKGFIDAGKENAAILARNAGFPDATGKDAQTFQKVGYAIATDPTGTLNAANMFAIPTKETTIKGDDGKKSKQTLPDFNDFAFTKGSYYYNTDGTIFEYTGETTITTLESYQKAIQNNEFRVYSPTKSVSPT
tara:strand:- start:4238 stop:5701 length:1464 start_codon:yes stop_codon:yes gene_type:complete